MNVDDFTYDLPPELIAARPAPLRDASRLLVVPPGAASPLEHRRFSEITGYLCPGDVLVLNNTRVIPARLFARRATGGQVEIMLLQPLKSDPWRWRAMLRPAKKIREGDELTISPGRFSAIAGETAGGGERLIELVGNDPHALIEEFGRMPLPPYILRRRREQGDEPGHEEEDRERYQTVYASEEGSVAAPTAGLHFTRELLQDIRSMGVEVLHVTLHVGAGTFQPMKEGGRVGDHHMHTESCFIDEDVAARINRAKAENRRIIAVGTTSVRTLESAHSPEHGVVPGHRDTALMIAPGYQFGVVDAIITNFHLPRSTLLLLVSAFSGRDRILDAYAEAVRRRYRFYSYGDAMMLL